MVPRTDPCRRTVAPTIASFSGPSFVVTLPAIEPLEARTFWERRDAKANKAACRFIMLDVI